MSVVLSLLMIAAPARIDSKFEQISPEPPLGKLMARREGQTRAVVLIQGLHLHPVSNGNVEKAQLRDWQQSDSRFVKELVPLADVYAFAYAQNAAVEDIAERTKFADDISRLRTMGYREVVLIGHSAGGIVAREFVEDHPDSGVTRIIQVGSPNAGSSWAKLPAVRRNQVPFLRSLTKENRKTVLERRKDKRIPAGVDFVSVVCTGAPGGDGVVSRDSQWSADLQQQGIRAVTSDVTHPLAVRSAKSVEVIVKLVSADLKRWNDEQVTQARKEILAD